MKKQTNEPFGTPDADGWYEWKGDDMIRPVAVVDAVLRDSSEITTEASGLRWAWDYCGADIVKWRPAK